jgi:O-methyltransferase
MILLSKQVDSREIDIIVRELSKVLNGNIEGDVVELGCYVGTTSVFLAKTLMTHNSKKLYVYDSFAGLPAKESRDVSPLGESLKSGELFASKKDFIRNMHKAGVAMPIIKKGGSRIL